MLDLSASGRGRVYVIAEAGVNHNGSLDAALQLVDAAAAAGADAVKFQSFRADDLATAAAPKAQYQEKATGGKGSQLEMLKRLELGAPAHRALLQRCRKRGIDFLSSPFDLKSLELLVGRLRLPVLKIPSGEITNGPLLLKAAQSRRKIILSTGMSTLGEIETALGVLAFGLTTGRAARPSQAAFASAFRSPAAQAKLRRHVVVLHCVTDYPARADDVNLRAMDTIGSAFGLAVGLSDHSLGTAVPIAATALGARVIEKHFTMDRRLPGPDHRASLEPAEFKSMVEGIRQVEKALGDGAKLPTRAELRHLAVCRKFLVAARGIRRGERYAADNVTAKRSRFGRSPMEYWAVLGQRAARDLKRDEPLE